MNQIGRFLRPRGRIAHRLLCAGVLSFLANPAMQASYLTGNINSGPLGVVCGSVNEPFGPCPSSPYTGPIGLNIGSAALEVDFGLNRVLASAGAQAQTEWMVRYGLTGATPGTLVNLIVDIEYDLNISAAINSESEFRMVLNNETLAPFIIRIATNGLGNRCDDLPVTSPCMSGDHSGVWRQNVTATVNPNNRMYLFVQGSNFGGGWVDAYNTARVRRIIVPDGVGWTYEDLTGNPLNFQNPTAGAVPEPASIVLSLMGLAVIVGLRRRRD